MRLNVQVPDSPCGRSDGFLYGALCILCRHVRAAVDTARIFQRGFNLLAPASLVHSYGTENRPVSKFIPPRSEVFEYIVFKGSDIKDLTVHPREPQTQEQPQPEADPAIVSVSGWHAVNSLHCWRDVASCPTLQSTPVGMPPMQPGGPPPRAPMFPPHMPPGLYGPYPGMPFYGQPPPMGMYPHPHPMGLPPGARIQGPPPMCPPNMADGHPSRPKTHSSRRGAGPPPAPMTAQAPPPVEEVPPPQSPSPPSAVSSGSAMESPTPQNSHQTPEGLPSKRPGSEAEEDKGSSKAPPKGDQDITHCVCVHTLIVGH